MILKIFLGIAVLLGLVWSFKYGNIKSRIIIIVFFTLLSCSDKENSKTENVDFFSQEISKYRGTRKILDLNVKFSECGEWGGHVENIFITTKTDEKFHLHYQKYSVDCYNMVSIKDSIGSYYGPFKEMTDSCTVIMNAGHKKSIYKFAQKLLCAKFREKYSGHAGNSFNLKKYEGFSGSEFSIRFYGFDNELVNDYNELIKELKLPESSTQQNNYH